MNPEDTIGKYVAYECEHGFCWALVIDVIQHVSQGTLLLVGNMVNESNGIIQKQTGQKYVHWKKIEGIAKFYTKEELFSDNVSEEVYLAQLGSDVNAEGKSIRCLARGLDWMEKIGQGKKLQ